MSKLWILICALVAVAGCGSDSSYNPQPDASSAAIDARLIDATTVTVSLASPSDGAEYRPGDDVLVSVWASSNPGTIVKVEVMKESSPEPQRLGFASEHQTEIGLFTYTWPNVQVEEGQTVSHILFVRAWDSLGGKAESGRATVTVKSPAVNQPPTVTILPPTIGGGNVKFRVEATDLEGDSVSIRLSLDGLPLASGPAPLVHEVPIADLLAGEHTLASKGDDDGNPPATGEATPVTFTVP